MDPNASDGDEATPTWVKVGGILALAVLALVVVLHLTGNGLGGH